jgi:hypothetical protein
VYGANQPAALGTGRPNDGNDLLVSHVASCA